MRAPRKPVGPGFQCFVIHLTIKPAADLQESDDQCQGYRPDNTGASPSHEKGTRTVSPCGDRCPRLLWPRDSMSCLLAGD